MMREIQEIYTMQAIQEERNYKKHVKEEYIKAGIDPNIFMQELIWLLGFQI